MHLEVTSNSCNLVVQYWSTRWVELPSWLSRRRIMPLYSDPVEFNRLVVLCSKLLSATYPLVAALMLSTRKRAYAKPKNIESSCDSEGSADSLLWRGSLFLELTRFPIFSQLMCSSPIFVFELKFTITTDLDHLAPEKQLTTRPSTFSLVFSFLTRDRVTTSDSIKKGTELYSPHSVPWDTWPLLSILFCST